MPVDAPGAKGDRSYKVVPWFVTTRGHGFHLDSALESRFDLRAGRDDRWAVTQLGGGLAFHLIGGPTPADALSRWSEIAGRPPTPPAWAFAPWMSTDAWRDGGEIRYVVERYRALGIPGSVLVFDSPWEVGYNDLAWNETQFGRGGTYDGVPYAGFASAAEMMAFLGDQGFHVVLWMTPFINVASNDEGVPGAQTGRASIYDEAAANGYLVREAPGGAPLVVTWWKGQGSPVDFTNPAARAWWQGKHAALVTASGGVIAGWKCDDGESDFIPETAAYFDGRRGDAMRTGYSVEYQHAVWDVLGAEGILWSRSGFTGTQAFPGQWAGDNEPNFGADNGLRSVIVAGLSSAMSGWAIWGSDIGGYQDANPSSTPENLFMRWAQFGAMSPIMQMHRQVGAGKQYPWSYGDAALANYVQYARLHTALFPYLYTYADGASRTGLPILRPPVLEHPDDPATWDLAHTYYLGESLLVAPVVDNVATTRTVYLPAGTWYDWFTGEAHAGGATIEWQSADQTRMPLFVRAGAIVPMIPDTTASLIEVPDELDVRVYPDGVSSFTVYDGTELGCTATADRVTVTVDSRARTIELRVRTAEPLRVLRDGAPVDWTRDGDVTVVRFEHAGGATSVEIALTEELPDADAGPGDGVPATSGCCQSGSGESSAGLALVALLALRRRR
jgi:alpha-D-xyloside xylohydrolase